MVRIISQKAKELCSKMEHGSFSSLMGIQDASSSLTGSLNHFFNAKEL